MVEYWPELLTKASWEKLQKLKAEIGEFVVIGGWAVYLWTGMHKSKDNDIIVDFEALDKLKRRYDLVKNQNLKKYEIKFDKFDMDIYVPHFSEFPIPVNDLIEHFTNRVRGFKVLVPEALLVLKQSAEIQRRGSIKGEKDAIDICTLMLKAPFDIQKYLQILKRYGLGNYAHDLKTTLNEFDPRNAESVGLTFKKFHLWRRKVINQL
ncbi:MAG: hypothetical protein AB1665_01160 [Candidatus Thermoplasmatota archaeon]